MFQPSLFVIVLAYGLTAVTVAVAKPCEELRDEIDAKIRRNGVENFRLEILEKNTPTSKRIDGTCNGGRGKITYERLPDAVPQQRAQPTPSPPAQSPPAQSQSLQSQPDQAQPAQVRRAPAGEATVPQASNATGIWANGAVRQCYVSYPTNWIPAVEAIGGDLSPLLFSVIAGPGDPLGPFDFRFSFASRNASEGEKLWQWARAGGRSWDGLNESVRQRTSRSKYEELRRLGGDGNIFDSGIADSAQEALVAPVALPPGTAADSSTQVDTVALKARISHEDGTQIQPARVPVWAAKRKYGIGVTIYKPEADVEVREGSLLPTYEFNCSADRSVGLERFKSVCRDLIERTTFHPDFMRRQCRGTGSRIDYRPL